MCDLFQLRSASAASRDTLDPLSSLQNGQVATRRFQSQRERRASLRGLRTADTVPGKTDLHWILMVMESLTVKSALTRGILMVSVKAQKLVVTNKVGTCKIRKRTATKGLEITLLPKLTTQGQTRLSVLQSTAATHFLALRQERFLRNISTIPTCKTDLIVQALHQKRSWRNTLKIPAYKTDLRVQA